MPSLFDQTVTYSRPDQGQAQPSAGAPPPNAPGYIPIDLARAAQIPMAFGKHKGAPCGSIPHSYMRWALDNAERLDKATRHVFEHKLGLGLGSTKPPAPGTTPFGFKPQPAAPTAEPHPGHPYNPSSRPTPAADPNLGQTHTVESEFRPGPTFRPQPPPPRFEPPPPSELANLRAVVKSWYRKMSQQFHPDLGGDATKQAVLNECYRTLTQELDRWESQRNNPADQSKPTPNRNSRPLW